MKVQTAHMQTRLAEHRKKFPGIGEYGNYGELAGIPVPRDEISGELPQVRRYLTNSERDESFGKAEVEIHGEAHGRIFSYLKKVREGPIFPAVEGIEHMNGYHAMVYVRPPRMLKIEGMLHDLAAVFGEIAQRKAGDGKFDPAVLVAGFSNPEAMEPAFSIAIAEACEDARLGFMQKGMMLGYMTPHHPLGSVARPERQQADVYVKEIPLIMVDRMHRQHRVFMRTPEEVAAYESFFGAGR